VKGSISVGKLADLVILSENIFMIKTEEIKQVKVLQTIMDGRIVYEAE
jgi:predicted amidohydrolase YtcJ